MAVIVVILADLADTQSMGSKQDPEDDRGNDLEDVDENDKFVPLHSNRTIPLGLLEALNTNVFHRLCTN